MHIDIAFKNIDSSLAFKETIEKKIKSLGHLLSPNAKIHVTFRAYDQKKVGDIRIHDFNRFHFAKAHSESFYKTLDLLKDKMKSQILKTRKKAS